MTASTMDLINAALAAPHTHKVVTTFDDGTSRTHETRSLATARNFAVGDTRNIGRALIQRATGKTVRIVSVDVVAL